MRVDLPACLETRRPHCHAHESERPLRRQVARRRLRDRFYADADAEVGADCSDCQRGSDCPSRAAATTCSPLPTWPLLPKSISHHLITPLIVIRHRASVGCAAQAGTQEVHAPADMLFVDNKYVVGPDAPANMTYDTVAELLRFERFNRFREAPLTL